MSTIHLDEDTVELLFTWRQDLAGLMPREWRRQMLYYRKYLALGWSGDTIHRRFNVQGYRPVKSLGQCGVTSAWLVVVLAEFHGIEATYCHGDVFAAAGPEIRLADHCWLEVGGSGDPGRLVVDITCDQSDYFRDVPVLCGPYRELSERWAVDYRSHTRLSSAALFEQWAARESRMSSDESAGDLLERLERLVRAVGVTHLPAVPQRWMRIFEEPSHLADCPESELGQLLRAATAL